MTVVFDGEIEVRNGSWALETQVVGEPRPWSFDERFANQEQGLLDVSVPWRPVAWTGTVAGTVPLRVEVLDAAPPLDPVDDDVVEASFAPGGPAVDVVAGAGETVVRFELPAPHYRVRYGVSDLDNGRERQVRRAGEPVTDRCWVQLWPAPPTPDTVIRVGSRAAAAWHEAVRASPRQETKADRDERWRREEEETRREMEESNRQAELDRWGGRLPGPRVAGAGWALDVLAHPDRDLLDVVEVLPDDACRMVALGVLTALVERTGLAATLPAVTTALADLAAGHPPRAPFRSAAEAWAATGGPAAPPEPPPPAAGVVVTTGFIIVAGAGRRRPEPTAAQRAAQAVGTLGRATSGFEALWLVLQDARALLDGASLAATVRAHLPRT